MVSGPEPRRDKGKEFVPGVMPSLSIIIPTFNSAGTIRRCLSSIYTQSFTDYEIIIQDGGSSDRTLELIKEFGQESLGVKIELRQEPDRGPYDAMNKGVRRATGEWFYFLGSDDELYDESVLSKILSRREAVDSDVLYGNVQMVGTAPWAADGAIYDGPFDLGKFLKSNICHQAIFYRAAFAREVGSYNPSYVVCADWDFNMRCWAKGRFSYVDVLVARFYAGGISGKNLPDPQFAADFTKNVIHYFNISPNDPPINTPSSFGRRPDDAGRASRITPRRIFRALARRLGFAR